MKQYVSCMDKHQYVTETVADGKFVAITGFWIPTIICGYIVNNFCVISSNSIQYIEVEILAKI